MARRYSPANSRNWGDPNIIRFDPRKDPPTLEELCTALEPEINVPVPRHSYQSPYRSDCMAGEVHPLNIETQNYQLLTVHRTSIDTSIAADYQSDYYNRYKFSEPEMVFIETVKRRPEVEWALDNSFDGLYIQRIDDYSTMATVFKFGVYLKREQVTFWRLKYDGR